MKRITLNSITLQHFKGAENETHHFNGQDVIISGKNGSGKTTIFDAFTWLLFGKDHLGRSKFDVKPLDSDGNERHHLDTRVEATISVDGETITLTRTLKEDWKKKRGTTEAYLAGHTEEFTINEAPQKAKEYKAYVDALCSEEVFRAITNPRVFPEQDAKDQRKILAKLVSIYPDDIRFELEKEHAPEDVDAICAACGTKSPDMHRAELAAKKKNCQQLTTTIPARIEEIQKTFDPHDKPDFSVAFAISNAKKKLTELQKGISTNDNAKHRLQLQIDIENRMAAIAQEELKAHNNETIAFDREINQREQQLKQLQEVASQRTLIEEKLKTMAAQRENLIEEWKTIQAEPFEIDPNALYCPCCKRAFEPDQAEAKMEEMQANFNQHKAERLAENRCKGKAVKEQRERLEEELKNIEMAAEEATQVALTLNSMKAQRKALKPIEERLQERTAQDGQLKALQLELDSIPEDAPSQEDESRQQEIEQLQQKIAELNVAKAKEAAINEAEARIKELRAQLKEANQKLADVEREEDLRNEYSRAFGRAMETQVNKHFEKVRFSLFEYTLDGTPKETCKATINGVAYGSTLNTAAQMNAGLDIIRTLCQHYQVQAPVFVDNAESVNKLLPIPSQTIEMRVTNEDFAVTLQDKPKQ